MQTNLILRNPATSPWLKNRLNRFLAPLLGVLLFACSLTKQVQGQSNGKAAVKAGAATTATPAKPKALQPGQIELFSPENMPLWKISGLTDGLTVENGILTVKGVANKPGEAVWYYAGRKFQNYILVLEFKQDSGTANSGLWLNMNEPPSTIFSRPIAQGVDVEIKGYTISTDGTGSIADQAPTSLPLKPNEWNTLELSVINKNYKLKINGALVNERTCGTNATGFLGIQGGNPEPGQVQFRNAVITPLADAATPSVAVAETKGKPPAGTPVPAATPKTPLTPVANELDGIMIKEFIVTDTKYKAGNYLLPPQKTKIQRIEPKASRPTLVFLPKCTLSNGTLSNKEGNFEAEKLFAKSVVFQSDWGCTFKALKSTFDQCTFGRSVTMTIPRFSTNLRFEECLFMGGFFKDWNVVQNGVVAKKCTFVDCTLPTYAYKEAAAESQMNDHLVMDNCHFKNCSLAASVLWFCRGCSFENCTFVDDYAQQPIASKIRIHLNMLKGSAFPLKNAEMVEYNARSVDRPAGSPAHRDLENKRHQARTDIIKAEPPREWKNKDGKMLTGRIAAHEGGIVTLEINKAKIPYPADTLSPEDKAYLEQLNQRILDRQSAVK